MAFLGIPNVSEGRRPDVVGRLVEAVSSAGARVLDVHSDSAHDRSVITLTGATDTVVTALAELAAAARDAIDLRRQRGVHPRLGALDVCPVVPHGASIRDAVAVAEMVGDAIASRGIPVYLYGAAARRAPTRELPELRRGGLEELVARAAAGLPPDLGPAHISARTGVVCVGARDVLIAFNVWLHAPVEVARAIARTVRASGGGPPGVRALGLAIDDAPTSQVAMNLIEPRRTGIDAAFAAVKARADELGAEICATEIVGLVPEQLLPDPDAQAARLLVAPGRSIESALAG